MSYSGRTKFYYIPYPEAGDILRSRDEQERMQIVDTQLYGAIRAHSGGHGVIQRGTFSSVGTVVYLSDIDAYVNQMYGYADDTLAWNTLASGLNYLFVIRNADTPETGELDTVTNTDGSIPTGGLLVGTAISTGSAISIIDLEPTGYIKNPSWQDHIDDDTNPHGSTLYQDNMIVSGLTVLESMHVEQLTFGQLNINDRLVLSGLVVQNLYAVNMQADDLYVRRLEGEDIYFSGASFLNELVVTSGATLGGGHLKGHLAVDSGVLIDNVDLDVLQTNFNAHAIDTTNPHQVTAVQAGAVPVSGGTLLGNLDLLSGLTVDGIDVSELTPLIDGSNCDHLHTHSMSGIQSRYLMFAPEFGNAVLSGAGSGILYTEYENVIPNFPDFVPPLSGHNAYVWGPVCDYDPISIVQKIGVPEDFKELTDWRMWTSARPATTLNPRIRIQVLNTAGVELVDAVANLSTTGYWTKSDLSVVCPLDLGEPGKFATFIYSPYTVSGEEVLLGEIIYTYSTIYAP